MSKILITGVNGFIGSQFARRLVADGHTVSGIVRRSSDLSYLKDLKLQLFYGDITDKPSLITACEGVEIIIHVAGFASDWGSLKSFLNINLNGTQNIAEAASEKGVKRLVHISSAAVHGFPNRRNMSEENPMPRTVFPYCESKKEAELWLRDFMRGTSMEIVIIRPGNVYGPYDHTFIDKYLDALADGKIAYLDRGGHKTCPVYIENLTDAVVQACFVPEAAGEAFIITDGLDIDWKTFTDAFADAMNIKRPRASVPFAIGYGIAWLMEMIWKMAGAKKPPQLTRYRICNGGRDYHFTIRKAGKILHFNPEISFDEAVRRTTDWYRSAGSIRK